MNKNSPKAFSLVEVLIVVAIIALLSAIAIPNLMRAKMQSNQTYAQATLKSIATALENYYSIYNQYPAGTSSLIGVTPPYLTTDYFTGNTFNGYTFSAGVNSYTYTVTAMPISAGQGKSYTITTGGVFAP